MQIEIHVMHNYINYHTNKEFEENNDTILTWTNFDGQSKCFFGIYFFVFPCNLGSFLSVVVFVRRFNAVVNSWGHSEMSCYKNLPSNSD